MFEHDSFPVLMRNADKVQPKDGKVTAKKISRRVHVCTTGLVNKEALLTTKQIIFLPSGVNYSCQALVKRFWRRDVKHRAYFLRLDMDYKSQASDLRNP